MGTLTEGFAAAYDETTMTGALEKMLEFLAKLIAFRCVNLTEDSKCVPATGIGVNWAGPLTIAAGSELKGEIVLTPADANTRKDFKMESTGDSIMASTSGTA